jgi:hypothetical protein
MIVSTPFIGRGFLEILTRFDPKDEPELRGSDAECGNEMDSEGRQEKFPSF